MPYLKYGSHAHTANLVTATIDRQTLETENKIAYGYLETWKLSGEVRGDTTAEVQTAVAELLTVYTRNYQDLVWYADDNSVLHQMLNAQTVGGVRITKPPSFGEGRKGEYSYFRSFEVELQAQFGTAISPTGSGGIITFTETMAFGGFGGPKFVVLTPITGPPIVQRVSEQTPVVVVQAGSATGRGPAHPNPGAPFFPQWLSAEKARITYTSPQRTGNGVTGSEYKTDWNYEYIAAEVLTGLPSNWRGPL